ncbi:hypothetical protein Droror1_Dr00009813 [Drosera rotundifolia]
MLPILQFSSKKLPKEETGSKPKHLRRRQFRERGLRSTTASSILISQRRHRSSFDDLRSARSCRRVNRIQSNCLSMTAACPVTLPDDVLVLVDLASTTGFDRAGFDRVESGQSSTEQF